MRATAGRRPRARLVVSAVGVGVVFVLCVAYIVSGVLGSPLTTRPTHVTVELRATGGLFEGSAVTYRGVRVGKVSQITFTPSGVEAIARLTDSTRIPADTRAVVRSLSPVGEQYLDLQPPDDHGPWLHDGSTIRATYTDIPKTLASTVISVNKLLDQVDAAKLHTVLGETSKALAGTSGDLQRLTDQGRLLVRDLNRYWPRTRRLLHNAGTLLDIGTDNADLLVRTARDFRMFARFLRGYNPELVRTLRDSPTQIRQLHAIIRDADRVLPHFLGVGAELTGLMASYSPHLRVLLAQFAPGLDVLARAVRAGSLRLNVIGQKDHYCEYGTPVHDPTSTTRHQMAADGHCPGSFRYLQRGAAHAPGPVAGR